MNKTDTQTDKQKKDWKDDYIYRDSQTDGHIKSIIQVCDINVILMSKNRTTKQLHIQTNRSQKSECHVVDKMLNC